MREIDRRVVEIAGDKNRINDFIMENKRFIIKIASKQTGSLFVKAMKNGLFLWELFMRRLKITTQKKEVFTSLRNWLFGDVFWIFIVVS